MAFPKLTTGEIAMVTEWIEARLRPVDEVIAELETPERLDYLDSIGAHRLDDAVKNMLYSVVTKVGGGNGGFSYKEDPSCKDVDIFFVVPDADAVSALSASQIGMLRAVLNRRLTDEILQQRDLCTIPGVVYSEGRDSRYLDCFRLGVERNGVIWSVPNRCRHCWKDFTDGDFRIVGGVIAHNSCIQQGFVK